MKPWDWVWAGTAGIVLIAIATKTTWIQQLIGAVKGRQGGWYYGYGSSIRAPDFRPITGDTSSYGYCEPLVQETYPSQILHQYQPHIQPVGHPNQHLCTGECKKDSCDSQGFCIDSGCDSVIRGESHCETSKTTLPMVGMAKTTTKSIQHRHKTISIT